MKKGQLLSQPFIYIFYLVVIILILYFGIRVIGNIKNTESEVEYSTFINEINSKINTIRNDAHGSRISLKDIRVPDEITEICFTMDEYASPGDGNLKKLIESYYSNDEAKDNVFFNGRYTSAYFEDLTMDANLCDLTFDGIDIVFENDANKVKVISLTN
jgi:hypothetical protein